MCRYGRRNGLACLERALCPDDDLQPVSHLLSPFDNANVLAETTHPSTLAYTPTSHPSLCTSSTVPASSGSPSSSLVPRTSLALYLPYSLEMTLLLSHLPAALVAAFAKRLARLSLSAPPAAVVMLVPFTYNLLKRHPACMVMIHRPIESVGPYDGTSSHPLALLAC